MRLDVTIFEKTYAAFPKNIEIIPDGLPLQIPPGREGRIGGRRPKLSAQQQAEIRKDGFQRRQNRC